MHRFLSNEDSRSSVLHSAKGSTWENHKYIKRVDGTYYYPDSYEGGRHLPDGEKSESSDGAKIEDLSDEDVEKLAKEVILGNFGNGELRKGLLGDFYEIVQGRVNEILKGEAGSKKVSEVTKEDMITLNSVMGKLDTPSKNSNVKSGVDMDRVLSVYNKSIERNKLPSVVRKYRG